MDDIQTQFKSLIVSTESSFNRLKPKLNFSQREDALGMLKKLKDLNPSDAIGFSRAKMHAEGLVRSWNRQAVMEQTLEARRYWRR